MKKLTLVACAAGLVAGGLATVAQAGQIQASSTNYAREAVINDTTAVALPVISYKLLGSVGSTTQITRFSMTVDLDSGAYDSANQVSPAMVYIRDQNLPAAQANAFTADTTTLSADKKKLIVTFVIPAAAVNVYPNPIVVFNQFPVGGAVASTTYAAPVPATGTGKVLSLFTSAGLAMNDCTISTKFIKAIVKHFDASGAEDDSLRSGNTNTATVLGFPTTHAAVVTANSLAGILDVAANNKFFSTVGAAPLGGTMQNPSSTVSVSLSSTLALLGRIDLMGKSTGYAGNVPPKVPAGLDIGTDADGINVYTTGPAVTVGGYTSVKGTPTANAGAPAVTAAAGILGKVEVNSFKVDITADQGVAVGSSLFLATDSLCVAPVAGATTGAISAANSAAGVKNTLTSTPGAQTADTISVYVCYSIPAANTAQIPSSGFKATATVVKGTGALGEQNNISCEAPLASLGGSLKIDVRNYVPSARTTAIGWTSVLRLINNSEVNTVKVYAQTIDSAGLFGNSAQINQLAPRAAVYMTNAQVDAILTGATKAAPNAGAANSTNLVGNGTDFNNTRLRITAEGSDTLRVQNYLVGPQGQFLEASGSQGVDLANGSILGARAGDTGGLLEQDAQKGLNGQ